MIKAYFINSTQALYDDAEFAKLQSAIFEPGIVASRLGVLGLGVTEKGAGADMSVDVSAGVALVEIVKSARTFKVFVDNDAVINVPIAANSSGANRVDAIVARVSVSTEPNVLKNNVATIERVAGTGVSALSDAAITSALGTDGWYRLANITVANGAVTIVNANIADTRSKVITNDSMTIKDNFSTAVPTGTVVPYAGRTAPGNFLMCDGSAVSRATYADLLAVLCSPKVFTVTIASPGVFTSVAHGLVVGDKVHLTTTGGLPAGLAANTTYYVISAGLTADAFRLALSPTGAAINTSGSQSGVHTFYISNFGKGDGSTTFNLPDLRSRSIMGRGAAAPTTTLDFETSAIGSNQITVPDDNFPYQGQKVQVTTTGVLPTGISAATDYFVIRVSATLISLATSQANANAGTVMAISAGSGVHTLVHTNTAKTLVGQTMGEEKHGISRNELAAHTHTHPGQNTTATSGGGVYHESNTSVGYNTASSSAGNNDLHNNMHPSMIMNYIIRI